MRSASKVLPCLLLGLASWSTSSMRMKREILLAQSNVGSSLRLSVGDVFQKRFHLKELMQGGVSISQTRTNQSSSSLLQHDSPIPLPTTILDSYEHPPVYLGRGSFGETWKAYDTYLQADVAVKMLYIGNRHVNWAQDGQNHRMAIELEKASHECSLAQMMQSDAQKDPKGASRLMRCLEDHVGSVPRDSFSPLYLVLEFCGNNDLQTFIGDRFKKDTLAMEELQSLWEQLNEGLHYMTNDAHARRWVHHDLKSANIVVDESQGHGTPLLKIIDFGSVTQTPTHAFDKPGSIGGGRKPLVATPVYAPYELSEPEVNGRYCYPWYSFDAFSAASTFVEMISTHTWTELLMWQCYMNTFDELTRKGGVKNALDRAIQSCQGRMHNILWRAQPQAQDINPELQSDYWGRAAIQRLRRLVKISAVTQANYNRRVANGRPEDARNRYYEDMHWAMSANEADLDDKLAHMLPNRRTLIKEIFDDYLANESESFETNPMRTFALNLVYSLSPYASERTSPNWFIANDRGIRLSQDFVTPKDVHFKAKIVPCESIIIDTCVLPDYLGGTSCPAHSTCHQTEEGSLMGALSKKCVCDPGFCVVDNECVLSDPPVLFEKHHGANAIYGTEDGEKTIADTWEQCEEVAVASEAYLYTYFSTLHEEEALRGLCVTWSYDLAVARGRLYVSSFKFSGVRLADKGVVTGVNVELYVPETKRAVQENHQVNVAGELYAMQNGFRGPPRGHVKYHVHAKVQQKVVGYRSMPK